MAKQWKQSLEQSDILSDGTPFDGAKIDQKISEAGGGVDWGSLTYEYGGPTTATHDSYTQFDISGSGWLLSISSFRGASVLVEIDGGDINEIQNNDSFGTNLFLRFNSSLKVTCDRDASATVVLE